MCCNSWLFCAALLPVTLACDSLGVLPSATADGIGGMYVTIPPIHFDCFFLKRRETDFEHHLPSASFPSRHPMCADVRCIGDNVVAFLRYGKNADRNRHEAQPVAAVARASWPVTNLAPHFVSLTRGH